jgi:creatinine amidohydrolase/Fe(II)-dependent formamide hydrolase-like protein
MPFRPVEEMMPGDVIAARDRFPIALVAVSPMVEWHAAHLPLATDGVIAEGLCAATAERLGGVYYRTLSLGLDAWRNDEELRMWGFSPGDKVFGMRFPELPISSEYCEPEHMRPIVLNRLAHLRGSGFRGACIVNNHGGRGQNDTLVDIAKQASGDGFDVSAVSVWHLPHLRHEKLRIGGHAGLSETHWVLAFRPELVDLNRIPEGELSVRATGILHDKPIIEERYNPRHALMAVAHQLRESLVEGLISHLREKHGAAIQRSAKG